MALVEISNFPGTPKLRCRVPNGTLFYDWLVTVTLSPFSISPDSSTVIC